MTLRLLRWLGLVGTPPRPWLPKTLLSEEWQALARTLKAEGRR